MDELEPERAEWIGRLIQSARKQARRSIEECAAALNSSTEEMELFEKGQKLPSLPQLEVLAIFLDVPLAYFWYDETAAEEKKADFGHYLSLRQTIVATLLRQARLQAGLSREETADRSAIDDERLASYELGEEPIPILDLESLSRQLGVALSHFYQNEGGPLARHEEKIRIRRRFDELPMEFQEFVTNPVNINYLQTAMRLSEMDVNRLRGIAESILDITL